MSFSKPELSVPWAEEVLVTKSDLEEKQQLMGELQGKVDELTLQNEYQLRLKDMHYQERIKEITDKFQTELIESASSPLSLSLSFSSSPLHHHLSVLILTCLS